MVAPGSVLRRTLGCRSPIPSGRYRTKSIRPRFRRGGHGYVQSFGLKAVATVLLAVFYLPGHQRGIWGIWDPSVTTQTLGSGNGKLQLLAGFFRNLSIIVRRDQGAMARRSTRVCAWHMLDRYAFTGKSREIAIRVETPLIRLPAPSPSRREGSGCNESGPFERWRFEPSMVKSPSPLEGEGAGRRMRGI